jgi:hypothetical protein
VSTVHCPNSGTMTGHIGANLGVRRTIPLRNDEDHVCTDLATRDPRDVMIDLALHFDFARRLGGSPPNVFNEVADRLPECPIDDSAPECFGR